MGNKHRDDPLVLALKGRGYLIVRLPTSDIEPLTLIREGDGGDFLRIGELTHGLIPGKKVSPPKPDTNNPVPDLDGKETSNLDINTGITLVGNLIGALGGSNIGLDVEYKKAKTMSFEIRQVHEDHVDPIDIDQFLVDAEVNPMTRAFREWLEDEAVYVITSILKSNQFTTDTKRDGGQSFSLDLPVIQEIVGAKVKVEHSAGTESRLKYEGKTPVTFGFQAVQLLYRDGFYRTIDPDKGGGALDIAAQITHLKSDEVTVQVKDAVPAEATAR